MATTSRRSRGKYQPESSGCLASAVRKAACMVIRSTPVSTKRLHAESKLRRRARCPSPMSAKITQERATSASKAEWRIAIQSHAARASRARLAPYTRNEAVILTATSEIRTTNLLPARVRTVLLRADTSQEDVSPRLVARTHEGRCTAAAITSASNMCSQYLSRGRRPGAARAGRFGMSVAN